MSDPDGVRCGMGVCMVGVGCSDKSISEVSIKASRPVTGT